MESTTETPEPEITEPEVSQPVMKPLIQFTNKSDEIEIPEAPKEVQDSFLFITTYKKVGNLMKHKLDLRTRIIPYFFNSGLIY